MSNAVPALALALCLAAPPARAEMLSAGGLSGALIGSRLVGEYADGSAWSEMFEADGTTRYVDDTRADTGVLEVRGRLACFTYSEASGMSGGCFEVWRRGANCFDFYGLPDGGRGTYASAFQKRQGLGWSARGWRTGEASTCPEAAIS